VDRLASTNDEISLALTFAKIAIRRIENNALERSSTTTSLML